MMFLKSLHIVGLHDTINLTANFNKDISLLVGINGCGKTSLLNVLDWLLKPDLEKLAITIYKELNLTFIYQDKEYSLKSLKTKTKVTLSIKSKSIEEIEPITIKLNKSMKMETAIELGEYSGLSPEDHEMPMWDLLKSFSKPITITLDRTITAEVDEDHYIDNAREQYSRKSRQRSPLARVQEVTSTKFAEYRTKAIQHDNELKNSIFMSALQDPEQVFVGKEIKRMSPREIDHLEEKVIKYLSKTGSTFETAQQVQRFFISTRMFAQKDSEKMKGIPLDNLFPYFLAQYRQVENLARAFNEFEGKNASAFKKLKDYLDAINKFFGDSNKTLYFEEGTGKLVFTFSGSEKSAAEIRTITHLSSGEKQILILFTFLAFIAKSGGVFIVDEPELSLHPKWQHEFMENFLSLSPPNTQLIIATHSPDIVGRFKNSCVPLKGRSRD